MNPLENTAEKYKEIFFVDADDLNLVRAAGEQIQSEQKNAFEEYLAWMSFHPDFQHFFTEQIVALYEAENDMLWHALISADLSDGNIHKMKDMSKKLALMGLPVEVYLSSLFVLHEIIENYFVRYNIGTFELLRAFKKIASISVFVAIDTFNSIIKETMQTQHETLMSMSVPVTQLWNGILFLPLVGIVDSKRAQDIMSSVLAEISKNHARVFILDISGVAVMDTAIANYLIKVTKATRLMGCHCIVSGISGAVAQTIVELGIQTEEVNTTGNMQDAVERAFNLTGAKIVRS